MTLPAFFADAPRVVMYDPLAEFLGAAEGGLIEYGYADAVKLAGHSCPTVAGAYLVTLRALCRLYGDRPPERGAVRVSFRDGQTDGVTGVMAGVARLLTGATQEDGFKGIAGRFDRRRLLVFDADCDGEMAFERTDNGARVEAAFHGEIVPADARMRELMQAVLVGMAGEAERLEFGRLWQDRVRRIVVDHADDPRLVTLR
ncbi:MAG: hypothetical protein H3C38_09165 [Rhodospirillales bacterium]|nr:hypothetical protein [Rhodospirillales bacterium]